MLNAYAFWKMGQLALIGSVASLAMAAVMLILTVLGFWHAKRVSPAEEFMAPRIAARTEA